MERDGEDAILRLTFCADAHLVLCVVLQETLDTTAWKLEMISQ